MTETKESSGIRMVGPVFVPVVNQDKALAFYIEKLGFEKRADFKYGESSRWIEVAPPGSPVTIALVPPSEGKPVGGDQTYCAFTTKDVGATHTALRDKGVILDLAIARKGQSRQGLVSIESSIADPVPAQCFFRDIDGNRFLIVETA